MMPLKKPVEILPPPLPFPSLKLGDSLIPKERRRILDTKLDDFEVDNLELEELPIPIGTNQESFPDFMKSRSKKDAEESKTEIEAAIRKAKRIDIFSFFAKAFHKNAKPIIPKIIISPVTFDLSGAKVKIEECRKMLEIFDLEGARKSYAELLGIYNRLPFSEKKQIYDDLNDIYAERKSAESLKR